MTIIFNYMVPSYTCRKLYSLFLLIMDIWVVFHLGYSISCFSTVLYTVLLITVLIYIDFSKYLPSSGSDRSLHVFRFIICYQRHFQNCHTNLHSHQLYMTVCVSPHSNQNLALLFVSSHWSWHWMSL